MNLVPHGICLASEPWIVWGLFLSDLIVAGVYFAIPFVMVSIQKHVGFTVPVKTRVGATFAAFIFLCGCTHLVRAITMFSGGYTYALELAVCVCTAIASLMALYVLFKSAEAIAVHLRALGHALRNDP